MVIMLLLFVSQVLHLLIDGVKLTSFYDVADLFFRDKYHFISFIFSYPVIDVWVLVMSIGTDHRYFQVFQFTVKHLEENW